MSKRPFYQEMRHASDPLWQAIFGHPFVTGIGDGTLSRDRFEFYLKQDYVYLIDFSRVFALASAKSWHLKDMGTFATLLNTTLNVEMDLHRKTCGGFGIPAPELERTRKSMITSAYTDFLVRTCHEGSLSDILAVLTPCACGYVEIGQKLKSRGLPDNPFYRDWVETYSSREFSDLADWLVEKVNEYAGGASAQRKEYWYRLYETSTRFEYLFFDMSWKKEEWPAAITYSSGGFPID
ncbi:MAG TPA: thiaminase II [Candidatus Limnocylindria bacterium]|nr:thiaminase II [Candidatus Limnocylindria bacterium]